MPRLMRFTRTNITRRSQPFGAEIYPKCAVRLSSTTFAQRAEQKDGKRGKEQSCWRVWGRLV